MLNSDPAIWIGK